MGKPKRLRSNPKLPPREIKPPNRPSKLCQWSDLSMQEAMKAVHERKMSINRAAMESVTGSPVSLSHLRMGAPTEPTQSDSSPATSESHPPIQPSSTSATVSPLTPLTPTTVVGSPVTPSSPESKSPPPTVPPGSVLAHYLVYPQAQSSNPSTPTAKASKCVALARVLTSIENLAILEEKEKRKRN